VDPLEHLAAALLAVYGAASVVTALRLQAPGLRDDPVASALARVCLLGALPSALLLLVAQVSGGAMKLMSAGQGPLVSAIYLAIGAGSVTTLLFVRAAYYGGSRAMLALACTVAGFFLLEALVVPLVGMSVPAIGLALVHFPLQIGIYAGASLSAFAFARHEARSAGRGSPSARRHRLLGWAFAFPVFWVISSFLLIRQPQWMDLGAGFAVLSQVCVWRAYGRGDAASLASPVLTR